MNDLLERALRARHPRALRQVPLLECGDGWRDLVSRFAEAAEDEDASLVGVKEKFGRLQIDLEGDTSARLRSLLEECEERSTQVCELCGAPGILTVDRGWAKTRCTSHAATAGLH